MGTLRFIFYLFVGAVLIRTFVFAPFSIPSASMLPNLVVGDHLFVAKWPYGYSRYSLPFAPIGFDGRVPGGVPERGDVVVFRHPRNEDWVKRVIGLPGDTSRCARAGILNGQACPARRSSRACRLAEQKATAEAATFGGGGRRRAGALPYARYRETLPGGTQLRGAQTRRRRATILGPITIPPAAIHDGRNRENALTPLTLEENSVGLLPIEKAGRP